VNQGSFWTFSMILMLWKIYSFPYASFSSSKIMEALWPFGVPKVRSSIPDLPMRPVGLWEDDMKRDVVEGSRCLEVWDNLFIVDFSIVNQKWRKVQWDVEVTLVRKDLPWFAKQLETKDFLNCLQIKNEGIKHYFITSFRHSGMWTWRWWCQNKSRPQKPQKS